MVLKKKVFNTPHSIFILSEIYARKKRLFLKINNFRALYTYGWFVSSFVETSSVVLGKKSKMWKKITQGQTDAQQNINRKARSLVLWLRWIEWKNRRGTKFEVKGYVAMLIVHRRQQYGNALWKKKSSNFSKCIKFKTNSDHFDKNIFFIRTYKRNLKKYLHVYESQILVFDF